MPLRGARCQLPLLSWRRRVLSSTRRCYRRVFCELMFFSSDRRPIGASFRPRVLRQPSRSRRPIASASLRCSAVRSIAYSVLVETDHALATAALHHPERSKTRLGDRGQVAKSERMLRAHDLPREALWREPVIAAPRLSVRGRRDGRRGPPRRRRDSLCAHPLAIRPADPADHFRLAASVTCAASRGARISADGDIDEVVRAFIRGRPRDSKQLV